MFTGKFLQCRDCGQEFELHQVNRNSMLKRALQMSLPDAPPAGGRAKTAAIVNRVAGSAVRGITVKTGQCMRPHATAAVR